MKTSARQNSNEALAGVLQQDTDFYDEIEDLLVKTFKSDIMDTKQLFKKK